MYNTIILSIFDYCDTTWSGILQQDQDRMQRLQKRPAKVIVKDPTIHSSEALNKLNWLPLSSRRDYGTIKYCI